MLGVVLWSDASDKKAVIWCEDQGDLAFVSANESVLNPDDFFDAGDLVQFDMTMKNSVRRACNTRLLEGKAGTVLTEVLKNQEAPEHGAQVQIADIIPFSLNRETVDTNSVAERRVPKLERWGA